MTMSASQPSSCTQCGAPLRPHAVACSYCKSVMSVNGDACADFETDSIRYKAANRYVTTKYAFGWIDPRASLCRAGTACNDINTLHEFH